MASSVSSLSVYIEHRDELLNYANKFLNDRAIAEDIVQEAWLRFSARSGQGEEINNPLTYLYTIVRNLALDWVRRGPRETLDPTKRPELESLPDAAPTAEDVVLQRDEMRVLLAAIAELPERTQLAFRLYKLEEQTLQEVADRMGISVPRTHQLVREAMVHATRRLVGETDK